MLTEFLRDQAFAIAWLSLMAAAWLGWAQEDPPAKLRGWLGAGSVISTLIAFGFAVVVWQNWSTPTALDGRYWVFGIIVAVEALLIGVGCLILARRHLSRWYAWWIGLCVALHFIPLAWLFNDWSYVVLALIQALGLVLLLPTLKRDDYPTSRWAAPWIGLTFLLFAAISAVLFLRQHGLPFG